MAMVTRRMLSPYEQTTLTKFSHKQPKTSPGYCWCAFDEDRPVNRQFTEEKRLKAIHRRDYPVDDRLNFRNFLRLNLSGRLGFSKEANEASTGATKETSLSFSIPFFETL